MSVGQALRKLGTFLDECEEEGTVTAVKLGTDGDTRMEGSLSAEIEVELSEGGETLSVRDAQVDDQGKLRLGVDSSTPVVPAAEHDVDVEVAEVELEADGSVLATVSASMPVDDRATEPEPTDREGSSTTSDREETGRASEDPFHGREVPPFRDPDLLAEVYASCETFAEMTDEIGMDVTAETIRRYMIDHGIHEPNSYDTTDVSDRERSEVEAGEVEEGALDAEEDTNDDAEHVVIADGIGLPDDVTVETLIETVKRSNTIYEVKQNVGIERQDALEILRELNLLDLVVGRLATEAERDISREEVVERLREASATASAR